MDLKDNTAKFYFDLAQAKELAIRNHAREIEAESSRLMQMELADKLEIKWFLV